MAPISHVMRRTLPVTLAISGSLLSLVVMAPGLDYFGDSASIDALAAGRMHDFFANQPLMGSLSLFLRAPFVRLVYGADLRTVYVAGAIPCVAALVWLATHLWRRMTVSGRSAGDRLLVLALCLGSVPLIRALHWGHPEDILATALAVGSLFSAASGRAMLSGAMVAAATASKQWGVLAALPALLLLEDGHVRWLLTAVVVGLVLTVPMLVGDPSRFWLVQKAAGSLAPRHVLGEQARAPGAHVNPYDVWLPFAHRADFQGHSWLFMGEAVVRFAHPLVLVLGIVLPVAARRRGRIDLRVALRLFALVMLLRCVLDPMSLEYYHLPAVVALAAAAAVGDRRDLDFALLLTAGLTLAFAQPATGVSELERHAWLKFALYLAIMVPAIAVLTRSVLVVGGSSVSARRVDRAAGVDGAALTA